MKDAPTPRAPAPDDAEKTFLAELERITKQNPETLMAMNIQANLRMAKAMEDLRDAVMDMADMGQSLLEHFGIEGEEKNEKDT